MVSLMLRKKVTPLIVTWPGYQIISLSRGSTASFFSTIRGFNIEEVTYGRIDIRGAHL